MSAQPPPIEAKASANVSLVPAALRGVPLAWPLACILIGTAWLLPNHHRPWSTFHSDAWMGVAVAAMIAWIVVRQRGPWRVRAAPLVAAAVGLVPWLQHAAGLVPLTGAVWVFTAYLAGLALALAAGEHWAREQGPQAPAQLILGAAVFAAYVSLGLQLYQWLGLSRDDDMFDIWVMYMNDSGRPYANLGQPNQLASLLLWGLVGLAWAQHHRAIRGPFAWFVALPLLFGLALTQSRTALLTVTVLLLLGWLAGRKIFSRRWLGGVTGLYGIFLAMGFLIHPLSHLLHLDTPSSITRRTLEESRLSAWQMFIDAVGQRPWWGYGWEQTRQAQLEVFPRHSHMADQFYAHSHNLFLDLVLWTGLPLGLLLSGLVVLWVWRCARAVRSPQQALLLAAVLVMGIHAMLELPLHYAYFLLPTGILIGALEATIPGRWSIALPRQLVAALAAGAALLLGLIVRDYFHVEESFFILRFESQKIGVQVQREPPDTIVLNHWRDLIRLARDQPRAGMPKTEVDHWKALVLHYPSAANYEKMLGALTLNGRSAEARYWAERTCAFLDERTCKAIVQRWQALDAAQPAQRP